MFGNRGVFSRKIRNILDPIIGTMFILVSRFASTSLDRRGFRSFSFLSGSFPILVYVRDIYNSSVRGLRFRLLHRVSTGLN